MKKIGFFAVVVFSVLFVASAINAKTYTAEIKSGKVLSVFSEEKEINKIKIEVTGDFSDSVNLRDVVEALIINEKPDYEFQEEHKLKNIFPWELKKGKRFRFTYNDGVIQSKEIPAREPYKMKEVFYNTLTVTLIGFLLSFVFVVLLGLKYKKLALTVLICAIANIALAGITITLGTIILMIGVNISGIVLGIMSTLEIKLPNAKVTSLAVPLLCSAILTGLAVGFSTISATIGKTSTPVAFIKGLSPFLVVFIIATMGSFYFLKNKKTT